MRLQPWLRAVRISRKKPRLIEVDYEVLQPVMTLDEAMKPDAVIVFSGRGQAGSPNIADHLQIERGDIDAGFKAADYVGRLRGPRSGPRLARPATAKSLLLKSGWRMRPARIRARLAAVRL